MEALLIIISLLLMCDFILNNMGHTVIVKNQRFILENIEELKKEILKNKSE